ncbi:MAG: secretin N-terminal domain-containing protein [Gemmataceae bacterium]
MTLQHADATSISNALTAFYQRVIVNASSTRTTLTQQTGTLFQGTTQQLSSVIFQPFPRFNTILVAAPEARMKEIVERIKKLDVPTAPDARPMAFPLQRASASRVATTLQAYYTTRYPNETLAQNQIRITADDSTNTVFVQAAPADLTEIKEFIDYFDKTPSAALNELRIVPLRNGLADEVANLIIRAISQGIVPSAAGATGGGIVPTVGGAGALGGGGFAGSSRGAPVPSRAAAGSPAAAGGAFPGGGGFAGGGFAGGGALGGALGGGALGGALGAAGAAARQVQTAGLAATTAGGGTISATKIISLRFIGNQRGAKPVESGFLEDIRLTPDVRTNTILVSATPQTVDLILALIRELDVPPAARAEINIFPLKRADAVQMAQMLQNLFLGTGSLPGSTGTTGGAVAIPGAGGGVPGLGGGAGAFPGTTGLLGGGFGALRPLTLVLGGLGYEGAPLIDLRLTADVRTNSLIVAGSPNDLLTIEAIITRIEEADVQQRRNEVYCLQNTTAVDLANALNSFITQSLTVYRNNGQLNVFQDLEREVVVVPEPITNKLLISATPRYYADIMRLIHELDAELPQVVIQVMIAEVQLTGNEEFGVEIGLQSPVLFQRGVFPATQLLGNGTSTLTNVPNTAGTYLNGQVVPAGVTVNTTANPTSILNYNFNNPIVGLPSNPIVNPAMVGYQGLGNFGTGRVGAGNVGGFVFSAASDSVNILVRALKQQGRIELLSRPQITTLDNQAAQVAVGQDVPYTTGTATAAATATTAVQYRPVGVILNVIPKINPDGKVVMRVTPQVSSLQQTPLNLGNGVQAPVFNQQIIDTTVIARDGETVAIGGLITRSDIKNENKIPGLGDLPVLGSLFRYRTQARKKQELLVLLTPHIVRNRIEADRVLAEESRRIDWTIGDVMKMQGPTGMAPLFPRPPEGEDVDGRMNKPILPSPSIPAGAAPYIPGNSVTPPPVAPPVAPVDGPVQLPLPRPQDPLGTLPPPSKPPAVPAPGVPPVPPPGGAVPPPATSQEPKAAVPPPVTTTSSAPQEGSPDRPLQGLSTLTPNAPAKPASPPISQPMPSDGKESGRWGIFGKRR